MHRRVSLIADVPRSITGVGRHFFAQEQHMKRLLASFVLVAGMVFVGCEKKEDSNKDVKQAADKTAGQAADALDKTKSNVNSGIDQAKDAAKEGAKAEAANMESLQKTIDDLIAKAKDAVKDKKWSDAENYIAQIKTMETKLPQSAQDMINKNLADVQKMIDAGKQLTPGK
jgi:hypothetical protein